MTVTTHIPERSAMEQVALRLNKNPKARNLMEAFSRRIVFRYSEGGSEFQVGRREWLHENRICGRW